VALNETSLPRRVVRTSVNGTDAQSASGFSLFTQVPAEGISKKRVLRGLLTPMSSPQVSASPHAFSEFDINSSLSSEQKVGFLRTMFRIRRFEQVALKCYNQGKMGGFLHLYIGQESVAVGTISLLGDNDHVITAYRDHGHALAVGMSMNECMAELFGKITGCSKGKGGSMHFFAPDKNYWGGHGIVAGQTPLGLGLAYAVKYKGLRGCCLSYLGDGAVNQGVFHESLNIASLWDVPVIYIIENNQYSMGTSQARSSAFKTSLAERAEGYNIAWDILNGEDIYEIRAKTQVAIERAHSECRPTILEIATYRYYGHSVADANAKKYRRPEEIEDYKINHDPLRLWQKRLLEEGVIDEPTAHHLDLEAKHEAEAAAKFAEESPFPTEEDIFKDVYYEVDQDTESGRRGRHFFND
jgi:pyruvate dehydrogenase E1 component alpha subunit